MKRGIWLALVVITLIGAGLRLYRLDEKSLWSDEVATIATSMGNSIDPVAFTLRHESFDPPQPIPAGDYLQKATQSHGNAGLGQVAQVLKANVHPPLFFWLMHGWIHAFGLEAGRLRLPAAFFGILCIPTMVWLALGLVALDDDRRPFSNTEKSLIALLAATFVAVSGYQIDHAQDARQYTLLLLFAMLAVGLSVRIARKQALSLGPWLTLTMTLLAGLYTQYFFLNMVAMVFGYLTWSGRHHRAFLVRVAGMAVALGVGFLPWWPVFKEQLIFLKAAGHYTAGLWKPLQLPEKLWRIACEFFMPDNPLGKLIPLIVLAIALGIGLVHRNQNTPTKRSMPAGLVVLLAWLMVVMGGQVAIDLIKHSHTATIRRYLLLASPACYLLMAYGLVSIGQQLQSRWRWWMAGALSLLLSGFMLADTTRQLVQTHTSSDEFKQAALWINQAAQPSDVVLVSKSGAMAVGMAYYLNPAIRMRGVDVSDYAALQNGTTLMRQLQAITRQTPQPRIWLVFSHAAPSTRNRLSDWLTGQGYHSQASKKAPGVTAGLWTP